MSSSRPPPHGAAPTELIDTVASVDTPERVRFKFRVAGPAQRAGAWLVDAVVQVGVVLFVGAVAAGVGVMPGIGSAGSGVLFLGVFVVQWLYAVVLETALEGRTIGKVLFELRVVRLDGAPARLPHFALRNLLRAADWLPVGFGVGVVVATFDAYGRRLGDWAAGTVVVAESRAAMLDTVRIEPPVTDEERGQLPPAVVLRPEELEVIESFLRRRRQLNDNRAAELAANFGPNLARRLGMDIEPERAMTLAYARATGRDRPAGGAP